MVQVEELQVLNHEYKIAKRIDVFVYRSEGREGQLSLNKINFEKVGYFEMAPPPAPNELLDDHYINVAVAN
jgi:hypothetical protein